MKNDYCKLPQEEINQLKIPDKIMGLLRSPFQFNAKIGGYIMIPEDTFQDFVDVTTEYAKIISKNNENQNK